MKNLFIIILIHFSQFSLGQSIVFDNNPSMAQVFSSYGGSIFNFTTNQDVTIKGFRGVFSSSTGSTISIWYSIQKVDGSPTSGLPGWINLGNETITGLSTTSNIIVQSIPIPINLALSAGDTIAIAFQWDGITYTNIGTTIPSFTDGTVSILADQSCAFVLSPLLNGFLGPRQVKGGVVYQLEDSCSGPPIVGSIQSSNKYPCLGQDFTLTLDSVSIETGRDYQWQLSNDSLVWTNISSATLSSLSTSQAVTTWYRCIISCDTSFSISESIKLITSTAPFPSGTYTIDKSIPNSLTNFNSFYGFFQTIACNGIDGPIILNVNNSSYFYEQLKIGIIGGTSATNFITINGNGSTLTAAGGDIDRATLTIDGSHYLTFNDLRIETSGISNAYAVELRNDARFIVFDNCQIIAPISSTATSSAAFVSSNSPSSATATGLAMRDIQVKNCTIIGGYYGLIINGPSAPPWSSNNIIENNTIQDFYTYGLFIRGQENSLFVGNDILRPLRISTNSTSGIYCTGNLEGVRIDGNAIHNLGDLLTTSTSVCNSAYFTAAQGSISNPCIVSNNLIYNTNMNGIHYGVQVLGVSNYLNFYHNTICLNNSTSSSAYLQRAVSISSTNPGFFEFKNNIFNIEHTGTGTKHCFYRSSTTPTIIIDYNQYYINSGGTNNYIGYQSNSKSTLAMWQAVGHEANGVQGNPNFGGLILNNLTPLSGIGNNLGLNLNLAVPIDFFDTIRSTSPDIGAIEYSPSSQDISLISGSINSGQCPSFTDTVQFKIKNVIGAAINFAINPLTIIWTITGPVNSNGTIVLNSGSLSQLAELTVEAYNANLSQFGEYTLSAHLMPSSTNLSTINDTLRPIHHQTVIPLKPKASLTTITNTNTFVQLSFQPQQPSLGSSFISEVCHYRAISGAPIGGWPSYLTAGNYIEITGIPNSDISGCVFESYSSSALIGTSSVLAPGTTFGPNGTLILAIGQLGVSQPSPANYYYHAEGLSSMGHTTPTGHVLKDPQGNIIDAVGYGDYSFPVVSGVSNEDWSGSTTSILNAGNSLEGQDLNNAIGWVNSGTSPQTPNAVNPGVSVPFGQTIISCTWTLNGVVVDTLPNITVGPWTQDGVYNYIANYITPCGSFTDTVPITVVLTCENPINGAATSTSCTQIEVTWISISNQISSSVEYGPIGFTQGTGTIIPAAGSPVQISGLNIGTAYDIYIVDTCANGLSSMTMLTATTPISPLPHVSATFNQTTIGANLALVSFDASTSTNYDMLSWDFGDGSTGSGPLVDHTYLANQSYTVILTGSNDCGTTTDTIQLTVVLPCDNPLNTSITSATCTELEITWNSVPNHITSSVEYGTAGFPTGSGITVHSASSPLTISGLSEGTFYDIYIIDTCANGYSNATLLTTTTLNAPLPTVNANFNQTSTGANSATVSFDASASTDYSTLDWDFGDGSTGSGAVVDHTYTANQSYTVVLTGTNDCGTTTQTYQVMVAGIGLESEMSRSLSVYPNPNRGVFSISFSSEIKDDVQISITSATGQLICEWNNASVQGQFKQDFDLSRYPAGVYFLKISSNQGVVNQRIILQK